MLGLGPDLGKQISRDAMTERDWLASNNPVRLLEHALPRSSHRKLRLFAAACARSVLPVLHDEEAARTTRAIELVEQITEDGTGADQLRQLANEFFGGPAGTYAGTGWPSIPSIALARSAVARHVRWTARRIIESGYAAGRSRVARRQLSLGWSHLLRDLFGPSFSCPITADPRWLTSDALGLARGIYDERAFDRMPILADALLDAGCDQEELLTHCRSAGPHVRGCWAIDLILGKE
jgi:hypothetical protein